VNKLRTTELLTCRVLTEKLDDKGAKLEHIPRKSLERLAQKIGVSKSSARTATQLLKRSVKVGVRCAASARIIVGVSSTKQLIEKIFRCRGTAF
jgi:hypothetical protein